MRQRAYLELQAVAALGAAVAVTIDFLVSIEGSVLHGAARLIDATTAIIGAPRIALEFVAFLLVVLGALSVWYLRPLTHKGAFACGFAAIAVLAIFTP